MTNKNIKLTVATVAGATALFASKGVLADEATQPAVEPVTTPVVDATPTAEATPVVTNNVTTETPATETAAEPTFTPAETATTETATPKESVGEHKEPTTYEKTGDTITITNPDVTMEFPGGTGKYAGNTTKYNTINLPDTMTVNAGDKIVTKLPEQLDLQTSYNFDVYNPANQVVGKAVADAKERNVTITFNNYFESHPLNKQLSMQLDTKWADVVQSGSRQVISFDGTVVVVDIDKEWLPGTGEMVDKWGSQDKNNPRKINWAARLNYSKRVLNAVKVVDEWSSNQEYVEGSMQMMEVKSVEPFHFGDEMTNLIKDLKVNPTGFEFKLDKLDKMVYLYYSTMLKDEVANSTNPTNKISLIAENLDDHSKSRVQLVGGRGDASGEDLPTPATVDLAFTKALAGRDLKEGEFTFELKDESGKVLGTAKNTLDGKVKFGTLTFDQAGTFNYLVSEVKGDDTDIAYDPMVAKVTITVDKDGNVFKANTVLPNDTEFNNSVKQTEATSAQFAFTKALAGRKLKDGEFTFVLKDEKGNVLQTVKNTVNGQVPFAALNYDKEGTYTYTVEEVPSTLVGVTSDAMKAKVVVTVTKQIGEKANKLVAKTDLPEDTEFNNTFVLPKPTAVDVAFNLNKKFVNGSLKDGQFAFQLKDGNGKLVQTKANDKDGKISFDKVTFTEPGEFDYFITELTHNDEIDYDTKVVKAHVVVKYKLNADNEPELVNGRPVLLTDVIYSDNNTIANDDTTFTNTLATPAQTVLKFNKQLSGRELKEGEFTFVLKDAQGKELETVTNDKDGNITFKPLSFDKLGTYTYTVSEVNSHDEDTIYDTMVANVKVTVVRDGKVLVTQVDLPKDTTFNNTHKDTTPAVAEIVFTKALSGRELKAGEFKFDLVDAWGNVVETVSNDAKGIIKFSPIVYKQAGTYKYTVREQKGSDTTIVYDPMVADVTINVTKTIGDTLNAFVATGVLPLDTEFNNTYLPPQPPTPSTPPTETPKPVVPPKTNTPKTPVIETPKGEKTLPHTGESKSALGVVGVALLALAGFAGYKRKES
jgi:pilin isopeptide linkage protein/LPXTG-motif cell wall-anchored protein